MSDRLREAVESGELKRVINGTDIAGIHPSLKLLAAAARRFLALTETGPDYEAAVRFVREVLEVPASQFTTGDIHQTIDAALADYLTEEDHV